MIRKFFSKILSELQFSREDNSRWRLVDLEGNQVDEAAVDEFIDMAKDFSPVPSGTDPSDGEFNAQEFRQEVLAPRLQAARGGRVAILLDGLAYPPSAQFIKGVFAPLASETGLSQNDILNQLVFSDNHPVDNVTRRLALRYIADTDSA